jgi:hypothetical protein
MVIDRSQLEIPFSAHGRSAKNAVDGDCKLEPIKIGRRLAKNLNDF